MSKLNDKNILFILPFYSLGGAETQAFNIAVSLKNKGHNVSFLAFRKKNGKLIEKLESHDISWSLLNYDPNDIHRKGFHKITKLIGVIKDVRAFSPDVLLPFTYYPNIVISCIWRLTGAQKCFWNQRGLERNNSNLIEKIAQIMAPQYVANSKACADYIENRHGLNSKTVSIIHNGIEPIPPKKSNSYWEEKIGKKTDEKVYTMVANFFPEKNHLYLLEAWSKFSTLFPKEKPKLVLVGYSPNDIHINKAKSFCFDNRITNIIFLPSTNDVSGLLQVSDYGILTSSSEGCPNSVLEYMLNDKLAIVTNIPATQEIFPKDYPFFCDLESSESLVNAFKNTLDFNLVDSCVQNNKKIVTERYRIDLLGKNYLELIN